MAILRGLPRRGLAHADAKDGQGDSDGQIDPSPMMCPQRRDRLLRVGGLEPTHRGVLSAWAASPLAPAQRRGASALSPCLGVEALASCTAQQAKAIARNANSDWRSRGKPTS